MSEKNSGVHRILQMPSFYDFYQWLVGVRRARDHIFKTYLTFADGCTVLDIGCGPGELLDYLPPHVKYTGFDVSADYIQMAKKKYGSHGTFLHADVNDLSKLPLVPHGYDIIIIFGVLHHLSDTEM